MNIARLLPHFANNHVARTFVQNDMEGFPAEHSDAFMRYFFAAYLEVGSGSDSEKGLPASFHFGAYAKHPLTESDRLGNSEL